MLSNGVGFATGVRWNFTLNEDQVACKAVPPQQDCMFVHEFNITDTLVSSNPNCPIIDIKVMEDDG
jgi:hypothetical protein